MSERKEPDYEYRPTAAYPWMVNDPDGDTTFHPTEEAAREFADQAIREYLNDGFWSEDVEGVFVAQVMMTAQQCDLEEPTGVIDEKGMDENGDYWPPDCTYRCNYRAMPIRGES